ncbi:MAG: rod shape-determining protein RodA, partial [Dethiobacteria bacterium]
LFVKRQAIWLGAGLIGIIFISLIDYINFSSWARYIYVINLLLLVAVLVVGRGDNVKRWIDLGFIDIQPSEYAKLTLIIILARLLSEKEGQLGKRFSASIPALIYTAVLTALIFLQPDLGTAMVIVAILLGLLYVAGINLKYLFYMLGSGAVAFPFLWMFLEGYQKKRLMIFLNPEMDPLGYGYQLMQSIIAVGSGSIWGKGLFEGTQVRLNYLPEQHTDFIFAVLGEELGFIGAVGLLFLFFLLIYRILWIGSQSKDVFGSLICSGVAIMLSFHVLVNIGMTIGIMPVTGLPLPFISYGGNSLLINFLAIGLVLNIGMRRQKIQF